MKILRKILAACVLSAASLAVAADFQFTDIQGKEQRLASYKGKWVLVNFWATWCPPCLEEIPELVSLYNERKDKDFSIISIAMQSPKDSVLAFAKQMDISYPIIMGTDKLAGQISRIEALPTSFLYDPEGKLVSYQPGAVSRQAIENYIRSKSVKAK